jgi:hypothetical protein
MANGQAQTGRPKSERTRSSKCQQLVSLGEDLDGVGLADEDSAKSRFVYAAPAGRG